LRTTCDSALDICAVYSVDHVLDQQLTRPEEPEKEEVKVAEGQETVWKALKGLEASGKYRCHFNIKDTITAK